MSSGIAESGIDADSILYGRLAPSAVNAGGEADTSMATNYKKLGSRQRAVLKLLDPDDFTAQYSSLQLAVDEVHQKLQDTLASASATEAVLYSLRDRELVESNGIEWKITKLGSKVIAALDLNLDVGQMRGR